MKTIVSRYGLRFASALAAVAVGAATLAAGAAAAAQGSTAMVTLDIPGSGSVAPIGQPVHVGGWAVDPSGQGTGVNGVDIYLDGQPTAGGRSLGTAAYGAPRADVASLFGRPQWMASGFDFVWIPRDVPAGAHTLYAAARTQAGTVALGSVDITVSPVTASYCTFIRPCYVRRFSYGWEVDTGGPGIRLDYFTDPVFNR